MGKKSLSNVPTDKLALYDKLITSIPDIEMKGETMPYTSLNGHMFSFLTQEGQLALRLPEGELEAFIKKYNTALVKQHGTVLKEYAAVPDKLFQKTKELEKYFEMSFEYVGGLKPKVMRR